MQTATETVLVVVLVLVWIWCPALTQATHPALWSNHTNSQIHSTSEQNTVMSPPPTLTHPFGAPLLSAHCGATWLSWGCAARPFSSKTMGWKPGKKLCPLRLSRDFRQSETGKRPSSRSLCKHTPTQASHTHSTHVTVETQSILATDRKLNKEPCCFKKLYSRSRKNTQNKVLFMPNNVCP